MAVAAVDLKAVDVLLGGEEESDKPPKPARCGWGEGLFMAAQLLTVLFIGLFCEYG